jgi:hypothetical protein
MCQTKSFVFLNMGNDPIFKETDFSF